MSTTTKIEIGEEEHSLTIPMIGANIDYYEEDDEHIVEDEILDVQDDEDDYEEVEVENDKRGEQSEKDSRNKVNDQDGDVVMNDKEISDDDDDVAEEGNVQNPTKVVVARSGKTFKGYKGTKHYGKTKRPYIRKRRNYGDNIQGITKPAIKRLARRGGVKRIKSDIYDVTRSILKEFLKNVIKDTVTYTSHARRKTVSSMDVVYALKRQGRTLYGFGKN